MRFFLGLSVALLLLSGCGSETRAGGEPLPAPWPEADAPGEIKALAEDLAAYRAVKGKMPDTLADIDEAGLSTAGPYAERNFAYHQAGIGLLQEGWCVLIADDRMRDAGKVWCVVRPPLLLRNAAALRVVQVPMPELREAAAAADIAN
jgi:hypothetical protein